MKKRVYLGIGMLARALANAHPIDPDVMIISKKLEGEIIPGFTKADIYHEVKRNNRENIKAIRNFHNRRK